MNFDNPEINKYKKEIYNCNIDELSSQLIAEYVIDLDMVLEFQLTFDNEEICFTLTGENIEIDYGNNKKKIYNKIKEIKVSHKYEKKGTYIVRIKGKLIQFSYCSKNIKKVINWNYYLENIGYAFYHCEELEKVPNYIPVNVKYTNHMLYCCYNFKSDISKWDVSNVQIMDSMFYGCFEFNSKISEWNVSNVRNMCCMFSNCINFNLDIGKWNVSNVQYMNHMFYGCKNFNSDISEWNVSNIKNMSHMFNNCDNFNSDLSKWDVTNVQYMENMFTYCNIEESNKPKFKN